VAQIVAWRIFIYTRRLHYELQVEAGKAGAVWQRLRTPAAVIVDANAAVAGPEQNIADQSKSPANIAGLSSE
jgi:hypothetical protein